MEARRLPDVPEEEIEEARRLFDTPTPLGMTRGRTRFQDAIVTEVRNSMRNNDRETLEAIWRIVHQQNRNLSDRTVTNIGQAVIRKIRTLTDDELEELFASLV
jgi:hypothetical protein